MLSLRTVVTVAVLSGLLIASGCDSDSDKKPAPRLAATTQQQPARPLDEARQKLEAAGYQVQDERAPGVDDGLMVRTSDLDVHIAHFVDPVRRTSEVARFQELLVEQPDRVRFVQADGDPNIVV